MALINDICTHTRAQDHCIDICCGCFYNGIESSFDDIGIVAKATDHGIDTEATAQVIISKTCLNGVVPLVAKERICPSTADKQVGVSITISLTASSSNQKKIFDIFAQCIGLRRGNDHVGEAFAAIFLDGVGFIIDEVGVVTNAAHEGVRPCAAVERIGARVANDGVTRGIPDDIEVACASESDIFEVRQLRKIHIGRYADLVCAFPGQLDKCIFYRD